MIRRDLLLAGGKPVDDLGAHLEASRAGFAWLTFALADKLALLRPPDAASSFWVGQSRVTTSSPVLTLSNEVTCSR
jgi:hypothetical protein